MDFLEGRKIHNVFHVSWLNDTFDQGVSTLVVLPYLDKGGIRIDSKGYYGFPRKEIEGNNDPKRFH